MQYGWDYQSLLFWTKACELLCKRKNIVKVGYEVDFAPGFDDVVVFYDRTIILPEGERTDAQFYQLKNHMTMDGCITAAKLMDPRFINASTFSLLQKLKEARAKILSNPELGVTSPLFRFYTSWDVDPDDILRKLKSGNTGFLKASTLFERGPRSEMGKLRAQFQEHLEIESQEDLKDLLERLGFVNVNQDSLMDRLSDNLFLAGLCPLDSSRESNPYVEATRRMSQRGRMVFDRKQLEDYCKQEGLWVKPAQTQKAREEIHVKSFSRFAKSSAMRELDLTEYFAGGRYLEEGRSWDEVARHIGAEMDDLFYPGEQVCLSLDTHSSIAFGLGYCLSPKSGINVALRQKGDGGVQELDLPDHISPEKLQDLWTCTAHDLEKAGPELAVAIGISQPVERDVLRFLDQGLLPVGNLYCFEIIPRPGRDSMRDMEHCIQLSNSVFEEIRKVCGEEGYERVHLFLSAPGSFVFQLGRRCNALGYPWQLYEFAFDKDGTERTYIPSLSKNMFI